MVYGKDRHEEGYAEAVAQATPGNGDFVAASRTAVPALVEALRASLAWFGDRGNHDEDCGWTTFGDIELRSAEGIVLKRGTPVQLTKTEFFLLNHLADHANQVLSRQQLLEAVWDYPPDGDGRLVDTHMARLRAKIEDKPGEPEHLITVRGLGYKLVS